MDISKISELPVNDHTPVIMQELTDDFSRFMPCITNTNSLDNLNIIRLPTQVAICDYFVCLKYFVCKYPEAHFQDIFKSLMKILFMSETDIKKILDKLLTNSRKTESICYDSHYFFYLVDAQYPYFRKGTWTTSDNSFAGQDLPSLVRTIRGGTDPDAIEFMANVLGLDFSNKNVPQVEKWEGHSFVKYPSTYPNGLYYSIIMMLLGGEPNIYCFNNANGYTSFKLLEWQINAQTIRLFYTLQQDDRCGINAWECISPPAEYRVYNRHLIEIYNALEVHIYDDIWDAKNSNTSKTIGTWAGDLSFAKDLDWSLLKGRRVKYIFSPKNKDSMEIGLYLIQRFKEMDTEIELLRLNQQHLITGPSSEEKIEPTFNYKPLQVQWN